MVQAHSFTVMVLEDEALLLQAITKKLQLNQLQTISCTQGKQAIDYLRELENPPDAIWLDYYLKDMDGLNFMNELKKNKVWAKIPVFVVSNSADDEKVHSMLALGAKRYLLKAQYRLEDIIEIVLKTLSSKSFDKKV